MSTHSLTAVKPALRLTLIDVLGLAFVYFVPTLSHLLAVPLYLAEPMRIVVLLALAHTRSWNAYLMAFSLPLFSFAVAAHPVLLKSVLISIELGFNVWLFLWLSKRLPSLTLPLVLSIAASKALYYSLKFFLLTTTLLQGDLISTPLHIQAIVLGAFAAYFLILDFSRNGRKGK